MSTEEDAYWMKQAYRLAVTAQEQGEVPVGAVLIYDGVLIAACYNQCISNNDPTAHAEIQAIRAACKQLNNYRLSGCSLYVTLEPCCMCASAMVHARVDRLIYAASELKTGAAGSVFNLTQGYPFNHKIDVTKGVLRHECSQLLKAFFRNKRN